MKKSGAVAIAGRPNSGKSTLLNRILESKLSIVTPKPQTTREQVRGILNSEQGQIVFVDTPGIHRAREGGINAYMVQQAKEALQTDDAVIWYLVDPKSAVTHEEPVLELLKLATVPIFLVCNKADVSPVPYLQELREAATLRGVRFASEWTISAKEGTGVSELLQATWDALPEGPLLYPDAAENDEISDRPVRFFVAEMVREQLFMRLGEELPYSCAVEMNRYDEKTVPLRIEATIHVERDSQKGMVIGKGGQKIKEIGQAARMEIEKLLGQKIFLGLKVNVLKEWSKDADRLKQLGYALPKGPNARPPKRVSS